MTPEAEDKIVDLVSQGTPVYKCCIADTNLPTNGAITDWMSSHPEFAAKIARARELSADKIYDEILDIADEQPPKVEGRTDTGFVQWQKNRMYAREQRAAKLKPKTYGDKLDLTSGGERLPVPPSEIVYRVVSTPAEAK